MNGKGTGSSGHAELLQGNDEETERMRQQIREQDDGLDEISAGLANMMNIAQDMNTEITDQNRRLEKVSVEVDKSNAKTEKTNRRIRNMI